MWLPALLLLAGADPHPDRQRLLGEWTVMAWQDDDFEKVGLGGGNHVLTIKPDLLRITSGKSKPTLLGKDWALDPAKGWFDIPGSRMGLYELTDDTLRVVLGKPNLKNRPTAFVSSSQDNKNGNDKYIVARREAGFESLLDPKHWRDAAAGWRVGGDSLVPVGPGKTLTTARDDLRDFTLRLEWLGEEAATGEVALRCGGKDVWRVGLGCTKLKEFGRQRYLPAVTFRGKGHGPKFSSCADAFYADIHHRDGRLTVWVNGEDVIAGVPAGGGAAGALVLAGGDTPVSFRGPRLRERKN